jgi:acyl carrier protein
MTMASINGPELQSVLKSDIRGFILSNFLSGSGDEELRDDDLLFESGIIDSTGAMSLILFLEERYDISVKDEELFPSNFASVERILSFLERKGVGSGE